MSYSVLNLVKFSWVAMIQERRVLQTFIHWSHIFIYSLLRSIFDFFFFLIVAEKFKSSNGVFFKDLIEAFFFKGQYLRREFYWIIKSFFSFNITFWEEKDLLPEVSSQALKVNFLWSKGSGLCIRRWNFMRFRLSNRNFSEYRSNHSDKLNESIDLLKILYASFISFVWEF